MNIEYRALGGIGANCYFVTVNGETAVIDPGYITPWLQEKVDEYSEKIKYILLTHRHADHLMGIAYVKKQTGAPVAIHADDAQGTTNPEISLCEDIFGKMQTPVNADIILNDGDVLMLGGEKITVIHTPGHSAGSVCYIIDDVIFTGDTLFKLQCGRTDLPSGSSEDMKKSLKKIAALDGNFTVCPGHGERSELDFERANNYYIGL